jgi:hypothetical protein
MIPLGILASVGGEPDWDSLSGYIAHWDASDASTITQSGGSVSQWDDKSGSGYHLTQGTGTQQPRIDTHTQNGLAVMAFDGTNDFLGRDTATVLGKNVSGVTVYLVVDNADTLGNVLVFAHGTSSTTSRMGFAAVSSKFQPSWRRLDGASAGALNSVADFSTSKLWTAVRNFSAGTTHIYSGTSSDTSSSPADAGTTSNTDSQRVRVGVGVDGNNYFVGRVAEIIVFNAAHTADERAIVWAYLQRKWAV